MTGHGTGAREASRTLFALLPDWVRRSAGVAVVLSALLGFLEFLALLLLFPVFTSLADPSAQPAVPGLGAVAPQWAAVAALALMMIRSVLSLAVRHWWLGRTAAAERQVSDDVLRRYVFAPYSFHLASHSSALMARVVANVNLICTSGLSGLVTAAAEGLLVVGLAAALIVVDPAVGLVVVGYVAILALAYGLATRRLVTRASRRYTHHTSQVYKDVAATLQGIRDLTVMGGREEAVEQIDQDRATMVNSQRTLAITREIPRAVLEVALYGSVLVVLAALYAQGSLSAALPLLALYVLAGTRIVPAIARMLSGWSAARSGLDVADELARELAQIPVEVHAAASPDERARYPHRATLTLTALGYRYPGQPNPVLTDVTATVPFGSFTGVVGESGSGKTTLTGLLLGLLPPTTGSLSYGGVEVVPDDPAWFRRVAVLSQEVFLTDRTLRHNLMAPEASDAQLVDALAAAGLGTLCQTLPEGLGTPLGERGSRLSAGQRQRVGLARALLRGAEILVLDEPTSALDRESEATVLAAIEALAGRCTVISVAHRVETLRRADQVIALRPDGTAQVGTPDEVLGGAAVDLREPAADPVAGDGS